jgi:2-iminobutanoate/2-iminopropanoate deaminase
MEKLEVFTEHAPSFPGVCSQALRVGDFLFIGGVIPLSPMTGELVEGGAGDQAHQMLDNLAELLKAAGATLNDVVKVTMYVKDWEDYEEINTAYCERFASVKPLPVRATVQVAYIGANSMCELEAVAAF